MYPPLNLTVILTCKPYYLLFSSRGPINLGFSFIFVLSVTTPLVGDIHGNTRCSTSNFKGHHLLYVHYFLATLAANIVCLIFFSCLWYFHLFSYNSYRNNGEKNNIYKGKVKTNKQALKWCFISYNWTGSLIS